MKLLITLAVFLFLSTLAIAQSAPSNTPAASITGTISTAIQSVNVPADVAKIQNSGLAVNAGFWYDWKQGQIDATYSYPVLGSLNIDNWGSWEYINIGYASPDVLIAGTGLVINTGVVAKKWGLDSKLPSSVITALNNTSIGLTPMLGLEEVGGKNRFTGGPGLYIKIGF